MNQEKLFSLDEANALLPRIALILERMQRVMMPLREEMEVLARQHGLPEGMSPQQLLRVKPSLQPLFEEILQAVEEIEEYGCLFKGLDLGLVDFPAKIGGEIVELCWQYGEKEIAFYHRRDEGFSGRRPLNPQRQAQKYYQ